jgi:uncharacterized protein (UPF0261 family)
MARPVVLVVGTFDTKPDELLYLRSQILTLSNGSCDVKLLDVSNKYPNASALSVPESEIVPLQNQATLASQPRGDYVKSKIQQCIPTVQGLVQSSSIQGVVSAGGSSGTSLATALMREACPVGFPKVMVSTMASGDIKPFVEETDITMMYSVVDVAGMNSILRKVLANAAGAIVGMVNAASEEQDKKVEERRGKRIAITMFGVTTPCVDTIRKILTSAPHDKQIYEIYVFHATGSGGRAMERLITEGQIDAVIDLTTTEIVDELCGGVLTAGPRRLEAGAGMGIPMVISVGACDMVNFGPKDTVPEKRQGRKLYEHNPAVTLMRTSKEENVEVGRYITDKLVTHVKRPELAKVLLPLRGISMIDKEGEAFHDREADQALFETLKSGLAISELQVTSFDMHINDEAFAQAVVDTVLELMKLAAS